MKQLKDIKLKKGDKLTFFDGSVVYSNEKCSPNKYFFDNEIIKIERPIKYETIYESPKPTLDQKEKEYLEAVIRPFKNRVCKISKEKLNCGIFFIKISVDEEWDIDLPTHRTDTEYKGMKLNKEYTLDELGLFKE